LRNNLPKPYLLPKAWQDLDDNDKPEYFTFTGAIDFFVEGEFTEIGGDGFFNKIKSENDNCFMITNVDIYDLIPHFEIGGK